MSNEVPFFELRLPDMDPERKLVILLLAMAREDRATEVEIRDGSVRWSGVAPTLGSRTERLQGSPR